MFIGTNMKLFKTFIFIFAIFILCQKSYSQIEIDVKSLILQDHLSGESLENATDAIQSAVSAAPTRVALPEIKLASAPEPEDVAGNEGGDTPPVLEYEREDDVVQRVIVNCSCGRSIPLDCSY